MSSFQQKGYVRRSAIVVIFQPNILRIVGFYVRHSANVEEKNLMFLAKFLLTSGQSRERLWTCFCQHTWKIKSDIEKLRLWNPFKYTVEEENLMFLAKFLLTSGQSKERLWTCFCQLRKRVPMQWYTQEKDVCFSI